MQPIILLEQKNDFEKQAKSTKWPTWKSAMVSHNLKPWVLQRVPCRLQSQPLSRDNSGSYIPSPPRAGSIIWHNMCHFQRFKIVFLNVSSQSEYGLSFFWVEILKGMRQFCNEFCGERVAGGRVTAGDWLEDHWVGARGKRDGDLCQLSFLRFRETSPNFSKDYMHRLREWK